MGTHIRSSRNQAAWGLLLLIALHVPPAAAQKTIGIIADDSGLTPGGSSPVVIFDADTDSVIGTVFITKGPADLFVVADAVIVPNEFKGFVTETTGKVWIVDLSTSTPSLAAGTNPIPIGNPGTDLALTPDGKFLVAADGTTGIPPAFDAPPVSVVEIATGLQVSTFATVSDNTAVDVCGDNSVLIGSFNGFAVRRLIIDGAGTLSDTGESLALGGALPHNVACAPGSASGVVVGEGPSFSGLIRSFTVPGLTSVDTRTLSALGGQCVDEGPLFDSLVP
jgi:hypothetical protein